MSWRDSPGTRSLGNRHWVHEVVSAKPRQQYNLLRPSLLKSLELVTGKWMMLEAQREGQACVVIIVQRTTPASSEPLQKQVHARVSPILADTPFRLLVVVNLGLRGDDPSPATIPKTSSTNPGWGIGVAGLQPTGSLGCYLEDLQTGKVLGLICGHNIAIPPPGAPKVDLLALLPSGTNIIRHSESDREERMLDLKSEIETHEPINTTTRAPRNCLPTTHSGCTN